MRSRLGCVEYLSHVLMAVSLGTQPESTWKLYGTSAHIGEVNDISADNILPATEAGNHHGPKEALPKLMLGAIGVVYGDIGTSPLYTMKESFLGPHPLAVDRLHILGVLSLIFWSLMLV